MRHVSHLTERNQVDVSYFTAPTTAKRPQSSAKGPKTQSKIRPVETSKPAIPDNLVTPRAMKSAGKGGVATVPSVVAASSSNGAVEPPGKRTNLKRPAPVEETDAAVTAKAVPGGTSNGAQELSKPPPKKRPKAAPSLFIPKNKVSL